MTWEEFVNHIFANLHLDHMFPPEQLTKIKTQIKSHADLNSFLAGMFNQPEVQVSISACSCGTDLESILQTGRLGCMDCYKHFYKPLRPYIIQIQFGNIAHVGKKPNRSGIDTLEEKMKKAVQEERYEDAAKLRDQIKEMRA